MADTVHNHINYVEFRTDDLDATVAFYGRVFDWDFERWGDHYASFEGEGVDGGFELVEDGFEPAVGSALVILFSEDLDASAEAVAAAGGVISRPTFDFPGGRRFHFTDPAGNELGVWGLPQDGS